MFSSFIIKAQTLSGSTNNFKKTCIDTLRAKLLALDCAADLTEENISDVSKFAQVCLAEPRFTYKQISLFGLLTSRSEALFNEVNQYISTQLMILSIEKLKNATIDHELRMQLAVIVNLITAKDYAKALKNWSDMLTVNAFPACPQAVQRVQTCLSAYVQRQIQLPDTKHLYSRTRYPLAEVNSSQKLYNIDEIKEYMARQPIDETESFTYAIDKHGNVVMSVGANTSFHINLCGGEQVYGAGELHLKRTNHGVEVQIVNNKSGLYMPRTEFLKPMCDWMIKHGFRVTNNTKQIDERERLIHEVVLNKSFR